MDFAANMKIKEEPQAIDINNEDFMTRELDFEVKIKVENEPDKCSNTRKEDENTPSVSYDELKDLCFRKCLLCGNIYHNTYNLLKHNITHIQVPLRRPKLFQCDECLVYYSEKDKLAMHIHSRHYFKKNHISKQSHQCRICLKTFSYNVWHEHMKNVHGNRVKCQICNITLKCERSLKRHKLYVHEHVVRKWERTHEGDTIKCKLCPRMLKNTIFSMRHHMCNCHGEAVECKECGAKFKSTPYLNTHIRRVHYDDGKMHKCEICMKEFKSPRRVQIHIKNSHINKPVRVNTRKNVSVAEKREADIKIKEEIKVEHEL